MRKAQACGFSMLEVVIAVVVISVMAAGFGTTIHTKRSSMLMQQRIAAAQLIDRKLAEIKARTARRSRRPWRRGP